MSEAALQTVSSTWCGFWNSNLQIPTRPFFLHRPHVVWTTRDPLISHLESYFCGTSCPCHTSQLRHIFFLYQSKHSGIWLLFHFNFGYYNTELAKPVHPKFSHFIGSNRFIWCQKSKSHYLHTTLPFYLKPELQHITETFSHFWYLSPSCNYFKIETFSILHRVSPAFSSHGFRLVFYKTTLLRFDSFNRPPIVTNIQHRVIQFSRRSPKYTEHRQCIPLKFRTFPLLAIETFQLQDKLSASPSLLTLPGQAAHNDVKLR